MIKKLMKILKNTIYEKDRDGRYIGMTWRTRTSEGLATNSA